MRMFILFMCATIAMAPLFVAPTLPRQSAHEACRLESGGRATGASADICAHIARRWALLLNAPPAPGVIRMVNREGYEGRYTTREWSLDSPLPVPGAKADAYRPRDGILRYFADDIIPHEAGHQIFGHYLGDVAAFAPSGQYGTVAPDWIDEAPAVWMESQSLRTRRMRAIANAAPSLATLVTMVHPGRELVRANALTPESRITQRVVVPPCARCTWLAESLRSKYQITDTRVDQRGRRDEVVWYAERSPTKNGSLEEREFYALAYSLLRFIRTRGGAHAVSELVARYRDNPAPRTQALEDLPNLPATLNALERAWHAFLRNPPPEDS